MNQTNEEQVAIFKTHQALEHISPHLPENPIIVEAGAYDGSDSIKMSQRWPKGKIFAFEPVPQLYKKLQATTKLYKNIFTFPFALSSHNGTAQFFVSEKPDRPHVPTQAGSLLPPKERLAWSEQTFPRTITVQTITLDTWAQQQTIDHVDLLWLDMQGHELAVLQASPHILATVKIIFTEVSFIEAYANQPQYDQVKTWLEQKGFKQIGKTFNNTTDWFFGEVLFVRG